MVIRILGDASNQLFVVCKVTEPRPVVLHSVVAAVGATDRHRD
jgi:hypothetical protein